MAIHFLVHREVRIIFEKQVGLIHMLTHYLSINYYALYFMLYDPRHGERNNTQTSYRVLADLWEIKSPYTN